MRRDDVPAERLPLEAELGERVADDRGRGLGGPTPGQLTLRGERNPRHAGAAIAGRLADEEQRRGFARLQVGTKTVAPRFGAVAFTIEVERGADPGAAQALDELL